MEFCITVSFGELRTLELPASKLTVTNDGFVSPARDERRVLGRLNKLPV